MSGIFRFYASDGKRKKLQSFFVGFANLDGLMCSLVQKFTFFIIGKQKPNLLFAPIYEFDKLSPTHKMIKYAAKGIEEEVVAISLLFLDMSLIFKIQLSSLISVTVGDAKNIPFKNP